MYISNKRIKSILDDLGIDIKDKNAVESIICFTLRKQIPDLACMSIAPLPESNIVFTLEGDNACFYHRVRKREMTSLGEKCTEEIHVVNILSIYCPVCGQKLNWEELLPRIRGDSG